MTEPSIERIEKAIAELGQEYRSPAGWEDRVRAATRRRRPVRWAAIGAVVAAAAAVFLWWSGPGSRVAQPPAFEYSFKRDEKRVRGESTARVHDILLATSRGENRAMWLYRGEQLVLACPGDSGCAASDRVVSLRVPLGLIGSYTLVELRHEGSLPEPKGDFDDDVAAAREAGASADPHRFTVE